MPKVQHIDSNPIMDAIVAKFQTKMLKVDLQNDLFANITFPSLPKTFNAMMADIEFPDKSKKNPNGTLFMKPREIDSTESDDIGLQCFGGNFAEKGKKKIKMTMNPKSGVKDSLGYNMNDMIRILEDSADMRGHDIPVPDDKTRNENMVAMSANVQAAINTYIKRSQSVIAPLVQMVSGNANLTNVKKVIQTASSTSWDNVQKWLEAQSSVEKDIGRHDKDSEYRELKAQTDVAKVAHDIFSCIAISDIPFSEADRVKYLQQVCSEISGQTKMNGLNPVINKYIDTRGPNNFSDYKQFVKMWDKNNAPWKVNLKRGVTLENNQNESYETDKYIERLFESDDDEFENVSSDTPDYDKIYFDIYNQISDAMSEAIGPREDWKCIKDIREQMKTLKDRADEEIKKKIELVCKTGGQKSLIHHPFKAEGLLTMWNRYSGELQQRIDNRINQLTGSSGGVETGSANMVEDFLRVTYPQIIAVLLTYRCVFQQLSERYKNGYIPQYSADDIQQLATTEQQRLTQLVANVVATYDAI